MSERFVNDVQLKLGLFPAVVFIDWFGTLSQTRFWESITESGRHPLASQMRFLVERLFVDEKELVTDWMRGELDDSEILGQLRMNLPRGYRSDFLERRLLEDCRKSSVDSGMSELVAELRQQAYVVIASDNMDCFWRSRPSVLNGSVAVDDLIVSSQVGALKAEDPASFFAPSLERFGMSFRDAVLIDDCAKTCAIFEARGGTAFYFRGVSTLVEEINALRPRGLTVTAKG
jgi:FMN phosphatase YigB (HAD superfamily)